MNDTPLISVIIPVYNTETFLMRCLDSVINQTYDNLEIILVDDGSKDSSAQICDNYADKDTRINVIHKMNEGVSAARNVGLDAAKGQWISFVDSDDYLDVNAYKTCLKKAHDNCADVVQFGVSVFDGKNVSSLDKTPLKEGFINFDNQIMPRSMNCCWRSLIKTEIINNNNIRFPINISLGEDRCFMYCVYACSEKIYNIDQFFYNYVYNFNGASLIINEKKVEDDIKALNLSVDFITKKNKINEFRLTINQRKKEIKKYYLFNLNKPNIKKWYETFADLNKKYYCIFQNLYPFNILFALFIRKLKSLKIRKLTNGKSLSNRQ